MSISVAEIEYAGSSLRMSDYSISADTARKVVSTLALAYVDLWLDAGSIYVSLGVRPEEHIEVEAKVIIGIGHGQIANIEILLDRETIKKLKDLVQRSTIR